MLAGLQDHAQHLVVPGVSREAVVGAVEVKIDTHLAGVHWDYGNHGGTTGTGPDKIYARFQRLTNFDKPIKYVGIYIYIILYF